MIVAPYPTRPHLFTLFHIQESGHLALLVHMQPNSRCMCQRKKGPDLGCQSYMWHCRGGSPAAPAAQTFSLPLHKQHDTKHATNTITGAVHSTGHYNTPSTGRCNIHVHPAHSPATHQATCPNCPRPLTSCPASSSAGATPQQRHTLRTPAVPLPQCPQPRKAGEPLPDDPAAPLFH